MIDWLHYKPTFLAHATVVNVCEPPPSSLTMSSESERNDADPNPKRTIVSEPSSSSKLSQHSGDADADAAHALTPPGRLARFEKKFFSRYVPSRDYVDVLCSRYWRYKDASFVFYRGAVLSLNHIWSRWCTANGIYRNQSYEWKVQRGDFRKVVDGLAVVWDAWEDLKYEIEKCGYRSPEDRDSFTTRVHDYYPPIWEHSILFKDKHRGKFDPFRDLQRREQMRDLYERHLPEVFGYKKLESTLYHCLYYDLTGDNTSGG
ncbi:hypothetical protein EXIGLDRAFT_839262 [Exidia glandulosa HHB12029]|uniref:Uncharacterized protein n=1 Tax=Exidia glandulosa HHB12029 TaxID=1314781 RepID=A0A165F4V2_EXIGL|nr:hypothetical protein EXIGLDRAFT_839262 [Exidia glandulosa HHB12029]